MCFMSADLLFFSVLLSSVRACVLFNSLTVVAKNTKSVCLRQFGIISGLKQRGFLWYCYGMFKILPFDLVIESGKFKYFSSSNRFSILCFDIIFLVIVQQLHTCTPCILIIFQSYLPSAPPRSTPTFPRPSDFSILFPFIPHCVQAVCSCAGGCGFILFLKLILY